MKNIACPVILVCTALLIARFHHRVSTQFALEGARVIVNGRSNNAITEALAQIRRAVPDARVESFAGDLSTAEAVEALLLQFPSVDVLVNNLGY